MVFVMILLTESPFRSSPHFASVHSLPYLTSLLNAAEFKTAVQKSGVYLSQLLHPTASIPAVFQPRTLTSPLDKMGPFESVTLDFSPLIRLTSVS